VLIGSGAAFSAIGAANAAGQDIRPLLNDLTEAVRSVQSAPERGVETITLVLQNLTTLTEMLFGRVRVLQGGNMNMEDGLNSMAPSRIIKASKGSGPCMRELICVIKLTKKRFNSL